MADHVGTVGSSSKSPVYIRMEKSEVINWLCLHSVIIQVQRGLILTMARKNHKQWIYSVWTFI